MPDLIFTPDADADMISAFEWYEAIRDGLGRDFVSKVNQACEQILQAPMRHAVLIRGIRRMPTKRFPYSVFYVVHDEAVHVIAVVHDSRDPAVWQQRGQ